MLSIHIIMQTKYILAILLRQVHSGRYGAKQTKSYWQLTLGFSNNKIE